ncbi:CALCR protein, partial [Pseudoatta argentina]
EPYCRFTFDGWSCWPNTPAGSTAYIPCPNFITGFDASRKYVSSCRNAIINHLSYRFFFF